MLPLPFIYQKRKGKKKKEPSSSLPLARLITSDQSGLANASASVMKSMENDFLYVWLMEGAPGSYYLVFLLPSVRNVIFPPLHVLFFFTFCFFFS